MAFRTTEEEVKEIIDTTLTNEQVTPFLRAANTLIDDVLSDEGYGTSLLAEIECWLAAHFVAIRDPRVRSETVGSASATYHGDTGTKLNASPYGQQVQLLDHHGKLAQVSAAKQPAKVTTLDIESS